MKSKLNKLATIALALFVVVAGVPVAFSQPARADIGNQGCWDDVTTGALGITGGFGSLVQTGYSNWADPCWDYSVAGADAQTMSQDIYDDGVDVKTYKHEALTEVNNNLAQGAKDAARLEAKIAFANAIENNATKTEAVQAGKDAASEYYAGVQNRTLQMYVTHVVGVSDMKTDFYNNVGVYPTDSSLTTSESIEITIDGDGGSTAYPAEHVVSVNHSENLGIPSSDIVDANSDGYNDVQVTLVDGSTVTVNTFARYADFNSDGSYSQVGIDPTEAPSYGTAGWTYDVNYNSLGEKVFVDFEAYYTTFSEMESQHTEVQNGLGTASSGYLATAYDSINDGDLTTSDLFTPNEIMQLSLDESDIGSSMWQYLQYRYLGINGTAVTQAVTIDVHNGSTFAGTTLTENKTVSGYLFTENPPATTQNGSAVFQVNQTYETGTNGTGYTFIVYEEIQNEGTENETIVGKRAAFTGNYTVTKIVDTDTGEELDSAGYEDRSQETTDASKYVEEINALNEELKKTQEKVDQFKLSLSSFSLDGAASGISQILKNAIIVIVAAGAFLLFAGRFMNGGGN
ncbi:hypothetical protein I7X12_07805 [Halosimplex litoreum]|uniref:Envelope protein N-terminal domain-containing protein n=1 Tax=Halosimplex litoreum TaxID=1198301 RepID=A0A7T3G1D6_9EURY|nr:hypothetical protein [Halosimplex litoreum]QPV64505.1 hypothetical protein I7X12_07805 [Halosimplex litoreum]